MPEAAFAFKPTLRGERALLRPFEPADIEAMGPILADPEVLHLTGSVHTSADLVDRPTVLDAKTRLWYRTRAEQPDRMDLAVVDPASGECVGEIVLNDWEPGNQTCNLRILIGPRGRGRGLGTEAIRLLLDYAFAQTDLFRIELEVYTFNTRALRVYERVGFIPEGRRRAAHVFDGVRFDAITMSVLLPDWMEGTAPADPMP
ncbi:GNAT family protein [Arthrobacter ginkgonis]|uniref:GNAT family protein n=1 Tax=Arthrobacter ginkgonis TaxID=1630594 RepID=A0ABP7CW93_9MICC